MSATAQSSSHFMSLSTTMSLLDGHSTMSQEGNQFRIGRFVNKNYILYALQW